MIIFFQTRRSGNSLTLALALAPAGTGALVHGESQASLRQFAGAITPESTTIVKTGGRRHGHGRGRGCDHVLAGSPPAHVCLGAGSLAGECPDAADHGS